MPKWLRPTGGSGIGGQPAFIISDKVIFNCSDGKGSGGGKETSVWRAEREADVYRNARMQMPK